MAFNPIGITTDVNDMGWRPWRRPAEPAPTLVSACCESQLLLIKYNLEKFFKKTLKDSWGSEDARNEYGMWHGMLVAIQNGKNMDVASTNITKILFDIHQILSDNNHKYVEWRLPAEPAPTLVNACCASQLLLVKYNLEKISKRINNVCWTEDDRNEISMWYDMMSSIQKVDTDNVDPKHTKSCCEIQALLDEIIKTAVVEQDEEIELRIREAPIGGSDNRKNYQSLMRTTTIQKSVNSKSMFAQIGEIVPYDNWGVVKLTDGISWTTLYEEKSTAMHITMYPSREERGIEFDEEFMSGMTAFDEKFMNGMTAEMLRSAWRGPQVYLEITKRYISDTRDELRIYEAPIGGSDNRKYYQWLLRRYLLQKLF
jgi:hypothetical protein